MNATEPNKRILVVDDDPDMLAQVADILRADRYTVVVAESQAAGEEALLQGRPDLAILDLMMEHMDSGFVLGHYVKKLYPDTPVILLTAVAGAAGLSFASQDREAQSWTQVDRIIDKPVRPEQLRAEVRRLLREAPAPAGAAPH